MCSTVFPKVPNTVTILEPRPFFDPLTLVDEQTLSDMNSIINERQDSILSFPKKKENGKLHGGITNKLRNSVSEIASLDGGFFPFFCVLSSRIRSNQITSRPDANERESLSGLGSIFVILPIRRFRGRPDGFLYMDSFRA